jgi:hypothetical protein
MTETYLGIDHVALLKLRKLLADEVDRAIYRELKHLHHLVPIIVSDECKSEAIDSRCDSNASIADTTGFVIFQVNPAPRWQSQIIGLGARKATLGLEVKVLQHPCCVL